MSENVDGAEVVNLCCVRVMKAHLPADRVPDGVKFVDMLLICPDCGEDVRIRYGNPRLMAPVNKVWIDDVLRSSAGRIHEQ